MRRLFPCASIVLFCCLLVSHLGAQDFDTLRLENWHQWRGPFANGVAPTAKPPLHWDAETNIKWKTEIPGSGTSTPIVWGDRIFLTTAIDTENKPQGGGTATRVQADNGPPQPPQRKGFPGQKMRGGFPGQKMRGGFGFGAPKPETLHQFIVLCLDRGTGEVRWQRTATEAVPHEGHHNDHGYASHSATTDGQHVYASFGSRGIYCYDLEGNLKWDRDLGDMNIVMTFGEGSSPVVYGDNLVVNWDHEGDSFIVCLDKATGQDHWRVARDESTTWNTPLILEHNGVTQVIVNGTNRTRSYDLKDGSLIWECGGQTRSPIPSPVAENGLVFCMSGFRGSALKAISLDSQGDVTDTDKVVWERDQGTPYVPSPLVYNGLLYFLRTNNGVLSCVRADTGEELFADQRLDDVRNIYSSITFADNRVFLTGRDGTTVVLKYGPELEILATNKLGEPVDASPVFLGREVYLQAPSMYTVSQRSDQRTLDPQGSSGSSSGLLLGFISPWRRGTELAMFRSLPAMWVGAVFGVIAASALAATPPENIAPRAKLSASSVYSQVYAPEHVVDGRIPPPMSQADVGRAWCAQGNQHPQGVTLTFSWPEPVLVAELVYYGRTAWQWEENWKDFQLRTDGSGQVLLSGQLKPGHGPQSIRLPQPQQLHTLALTFTSSYGGSNPGASEIEVYGAALPKAFFASFRPPQTQTARAGPDLTQVARQSVPEDAHLAQTVRQGGFGFHSLIVIQRHAVDPSHVYTYHVEGQQPGGGLYRLDLQTPGAASTSAALHPVGRRCGRLDPGRERLLRRADCALQLEAIDAGQAAAVHHRRGRQ